MEMQNTIDHRGRVLENPWIRILLLIFLLLLVSILIGQQMEPQKNVPASTHDEVAQIKLPPPVLTGKISIEEALSQRRSVRDYSDDSLSLQEIAQLLWAAQGITDPGGGRTAPSAGALYPLEIYLVSGKIKDLPAGVFHYKPVDHSLEQLSDDDKLARLYRSALMQGSIKHGSAVIVIAAVFSRTTKKYGERGNRYVYVEAGHAAQNVCLQAISLGAGTVTVGAFRDSAVCRVLELPGDEAPLYLLPVGKK